MELHLMNYYCNLNMAERRAESRSFNFFPTNILCYMSSPPRSSLKSFRKLKKSNSKSWKIVLCILNPAQSRFVRSCWMSVLLAALALWAAAFAPPERKRAASLCGCRLSEWMEGRGNHGGKKTHTKKTRPASAARCVKLLKEIHSRSCSFKGPEEGLSS